MFKIVKDRPMPAVTASRPANRLYPFDEMEVGDSFTIPKKDWPLGVIDGNAVAKKVKNSAREMASRSYRDAVAAAQRAGEDATKVQKRSYLTLLEGTGDDETVTTWRTA